MKNTILLLAAAAIMTSCGGGNEATDTPEADATKICDCYSSKKGGNTDECAEMYTTISKKYREEIKGSWDKFYTTYMGCLGK